MKGLERIYKARTGLAAYRRKAWEAFKWPAERSEPYKYMPMRELANQEIELCDGNWEYTIPEHVVSMPLSQAWNSYGAFLQKRQLSEAPFALMTKALMDDGLFLYVPPNVHVKETLHLRLDQKMFPHVTVLMGKGAHLKIVLEGSCAHFSTSFLDIDLDEGAHLTWVDKVQTTDTTWRLDTAFALLRKNAQFYHYQITSGGKCVRSDVRVQLLGENASATMKGLAQLLRKRQAHQYVHVEHMAESTHSDQHYKTVLEDASEASFEGKIYVHSHAQKTMAYQLNNNLLLGQHVVANSKPNLEIFADDVKASHGCTMTQLSAEEMFYLKSRGVGQSLAHQLLKKGFIQEILYAMQDSDRY